MRIVDVCAFYAPKGGGVRTYIDRKLAAGAAAGHDIVVIAPGPADRTEIRPGGGRVEWLASPKFPLDRNYHFFADMARLHAAMTAARPDFVEASSPWRSASLVAAWRSPVPRALIMHADPLAAYAYRWFEDVAPRDRIDRGFDWYWRHLRRLDVAFDLVVSASPSLSQRLTAGGLRRVVTIPMGVDPGIFSPARRNADLRRALLARCALGEDATLLLGVGRFAPEKRWPMVIDAVTAAGFDQPVALVLVGDGRERGRIVRRIGGNPHIQLLGATADRIELARLMASADCLIHGCEAETFCMVAAEAAASGLPLLVPDIGGAADQARATNGLCYVAADAGSAADAIRAFAAAPRPTAAAAPIRTMDDHFAALFAHYARLAQPLRRAA